MIVVLFALWAPVALAHNTKSAWTTAKANVMLPDVVKIALPPDLAQALEGEIGPLLAQLRQLELNAQQERNDWLAAGTYGNYVKRLGDAREKVQKGLSVDPATCVGTGTALKGNRYKHFRCSATSYVLEVPSIELKPGANGSLPEVVEGPIRRFGPFQATFTLHVTGPATCVCIRLS